MNAIATLMQSYVKKNGWFSVGNIYFDNSFTANPFTADGRICISVSANTLFVTSRYDTIVSEKLETLMANNLKYAGYQQTITCCDLDCLQHFDANMFCHERQYSLDPTTFPAPMIPKPADFLNAKPDPETGLVPDKPYITDLNDGQVSIFDVYPGFPLEHMHGIRILPVKEFYQNQEIFCKAMNKMFGVGDCA